MSRRHCLGWGLSSPRIILPALQMRNHATKNLHALGLAVCEQIILVLGAPNPLPHRGEAGWHPPGRNRQGRLPAMQAALRGEISGHDGRPIGWVGSQSD